MKSSDIQFKRKKLSVGKFANIGSKKTFDYQTGGLQQRKQCVFQRFVTLD
jgi:hypothetical protein